jgi:hypothetical protein
MGRISNLSPIVIFAYRRNIDKTIESLLSNTLAKESELFIFSDGYKNINDKNDVLDVRRSLKQINGFKSITIYESEKNKGLANSIIDGSTKIINNYGRTIVLEDDLIVSIDFLEYMNEALNRYEINKNIWSITGYSPNIENINSSKDLYLSPRGSSWSWATWKDRWDIIDWKITDFNNIKNDKILQDKFNLGGDDLYKMLELQMLGKIDSWAIRWVYNQFKVNMYTIYPTRSKITNNGFTDGKGTHNNIQNDKWLVEINHTKIDFTDLDIDENIINKFKLFYDLSLKTKIGFFLKKYGMYNAAKKVYRLVIKLKNIKEDIKWKNINIK